MSEAVQTRYRLVNVEQMLALTGWSETTLDRRIRAGTFPEAIEGGKGRTRRWTLAQYEKWAKAQEVAAENA